MNRFKGLDLVDRVPDELRTEAHKIVHEMVTKTIPKKKKCKKAKWLSEEALQSWGKKRSKRLFSSSSNFAIKVVLSPYQRFLIFLLTILVPACDFSSLTSGMIYSATAAAAAKSLQSCLTLCDPIDGSPPGSPVPGILQARTLAWVAISFSNAWK